MSKMYRVKYLKSQSLGWRPPFLGSAPSRFLGGRGFQCLLRRALFVLTEAPALHLPTSGAGVAEESGVRSDAAPLLLSPSVPLLEG